MDLYSWQNQAIVTWDLIGASISHMTIYLFILIWTSYTNEYTSAYIFVSLLIGRVTSSDAVLFVYISWHNGLVLRQLRNEFNPLFCCCRYLKLTKCWWWPLNDDDDDGDDDNDGEEDEEEEETKDLVFR